MEELRYENEYLKEKIAKLEGLLQAAEVRINDRIGLLKEVPLPIKPPTTNETDGRWGRVKKGKSRNLVERFQKRKPEMLRFAYDLNVSFDNNLAQRDIRIWKTSLVC